MGWMLVMFDLPVMTKKQRKQATKFRKTLLDDGYFMVQYSVYARACPSMERVEKHRARLEKSVPHAGNIRVLFTTNGRKAYSSQGQTTSKAIDNWNLTYQNKQCFGNRISHPVQCTQCREGAGG